MWQFEAQWEAPSGLMADQCPRAQPSDRAVHSGFDRPSSPTCTYSMQHLYRRTVRNFDCTLPYRMSHDRWHAFADRAGIRRYCPCYLYSVNITYVLSVYRTCRSTSKVERTQLCHEHLIVVKSSKSSAQRPKGLIVLLYLPARTRTSKTRCSTWR